MITKEEACRWYFGGGYEELNKLQQVDYLVTYCGYTEPGAFDLVYGCVYDEDTLEDAIEEYWEEWEGYED